MAWRTLYKMQDGEIALAEPQDKINECFSGSDAAGLHPEAWARYCKLLAEMKTFNSNLAGTAKAIVEKTIQDTLKERGNTHGNFRDNARISQYLKSYWRNHQTAWEELSAIQQEALDMIASKICRILSGNPDEPDHWHDIAGYATLVENELKK